MANKRISELPEATTILDNDLFAIAQDPGSGLITKSVKLSTLKLNILTSGSMLTYKGTWNAAANSPAIPAAAPSNTGWYYVVSVGGTTSINGVADWQAKDWIVSNGSTWDKIDNSEQYLLDITHANLLTAIGANSLVPGLYYRITDFQTVHVIPETTVVNTGAVEPLICYAMSNNKLKLEVLSESQPKDIIHYDVSNVLAENGTTARKGKITYRKDTINNLETWYDFRNVKFRRWLIDGTGMSAWAASTSYTRGQLFAINGEVYKVIFDHTSSANFNTDLSDNKVASLVGSSSGFVAWKTAITEFGGTISVNTSQFQDYLTFSSNSNGISIPRSTTQPYNNVVYINSPGQSDTFGSNVLNVTIAGASKNNFVENESSGIIFNGSAESNHIGKSNSGIFILGGSRFNKTGNHVQVLIINGACDKNSIETGCTNNFIIGSASFNFIDKSSEYNIINGGSNYNTLGLKSVGNRIYGGCSGNYIGDAVLPSGQGAVNNVISNGSYANRIMAGGTGNNIFGASNSNTIGFNGQNNTFNAANSNTLGKDCISNSLVGNSNFNLLGDNCGSNSLNGGSSNNILRNGCNSNVFVSSIENIIDSNSDSNQFTSANSNYIGIHSSFNTFENSSNGNSVGNYSNNNIFRNSTYGGGSYNRVGHNCTLLEIAGSNSVFENGCSAIKATNNLGFFNCHFTEGVQNKTFVGQRILNGLKILVSTSSVQTFPLASQLPNDIVVDMKVEGSGQLWYRKIDSAGVISTFKFE